MGKVLVLDQILAPVIVVGRETLIVLYLLVMEEIIAVDMVLVLEPTIVHVMMVGRQTPVVPQ